MMTTMVISHSLTPSLIRPSLLRSHRLLFSETCSITRTATSSRTRRNNLYSVMASSSSSEQTSDPWTNFPYLSPSGSRLMENIAHTIATNLSSSLLCASRTPPEVCRFKNPQGNNEGSVILRSGASGSPVSPLFFFFGFYALFFFLEFYAFFFFVFFLFLFCLSYFIYP